MKTKKTIFFLINSMENGGAERVISNILPPLSKKYDVYLILLKNKIFYPLPSTVHIISLSNIKQNILLPLLLPFYFLKLKILIRKHKPAKIVSFLEIANFVNILTNKNAFISFRTSLSFFEKTFFGKIYILAIKFFYPRAKKIIVNSKENKIDLARKLNIPLEKITTIYNPINITKINSLKQKFLKLPFEKDASQKIFITIGRMDKLKNISTIINSFRKTSEKNILLIIGDGPEKTALKNLIIKNNLQSQVFLIGRKKNVYKYLNIADYFVFTSKTEGFPNVLLEAMACRLSIITSDFKTGAREVIDSNLKFTKKIKYPHYGPNGALLSVNNFEKDFQKIDFAKLKQKQIGLEKFTLKTIIKEWVDILQ
jgi:N-acetylgalactosamine-N,N'-diacetylbacillosaminyl-diphospho-undecaprenol 4-alpha-N-acetylgalactosaminyltransferase